MSFKRKGVESGSLLLSQIALAELPQALGHKSEENATLLGACCQCHASRSAERAKASVTLSCDGRFQSLATVATGDESWGLKPNIVAGIWWACFGC
jgi:hypothetical protein